MIPTTCAQLLAVKDVIAALRISRASVSFRKVRTRKPLPANARVRQTSDRYRGNVVLHQVDLGDRNAPRWDEPITRGVAQDITWKTKYDTALVSSGPPGVQQISATAQRWHQP